MNFHENRLPDFPEQVSKIIPRLSTDHVGELVAARDAIDRALRRAGLDWFDVARACTSTRHRGATPPSLPSFGDLSRACRDLDRGTLTPHEREFVASMCRLGFNGHPSHRQLEWLAAIFARLQRRAA